jgi:hypothetical protein
MTLLDHPQAQTLLNDAILRPTDIASCADHLQTFVQRYGPCQKICNPTLMIVSAMPTTS